MAKKKKIKAKTTPNDTGFLDHATKNMVVYGQHTLQDRSIPELKDGLKPVHRRILYTAYLSGMKSNGPTKKCARLVGECLGKFHPHGSDACYGALVTIANAPTPLLKKQGNFGNKVTGDAAAAFRYCVVGDTPIFLEKGIFTAEELKPSNVEKPKIGQAYPIEGHRTPSLDSKWAEVSHWIYSGVREVYSIESDNAPLITVTKNEPFLVVTESGFLWKTVEELVRGDIVATTSQTINPQSNRDALSDSEALFLGLLIGGGQITIQGITFSTKHSSVSSTYQDVATQVYCSPKQEIIPSGPGKEYYLSTLDNRAVIGDLESKYGIVPTPSTGKHIPERLRKSPKEIVVSFLSGLFETAGDISSRKVVLFHRSRALLLEVQTLLLAYFGLRTNIKVGTRGDLRRLGLHIEGYQQCRQFLSAVPFISDLKKQKALNLYTQGALILPQNRKQDFLPFIDKIQDPKIKTYPYEVYLDRENFRTHFFSFFKEIQNKYAHHYNSGYIYSTITSITKLKEKRKVYDLTVPETHAYCANGYIIHNTECKLSTAAETFLLDPQYLAVTPMVPNYDGHEQEPVYLPAKIPMLLVLGTEAGIATGASTVIPSFTLDSVIQLTQASIKAGKCTAKMCYDLLEFNFTEGGQVWAEDKDLLKFYKTGEASATNSKLWVMPNAHYDSKEHAVVLTSFAPRMKYDELFVIGLGLEGVSSMEDLSGSDSGVRILFRLNKSINKKVADKHVSIVQDALSKVIPYSIMVTQRHDNGESVTFKYASIPEIVNDWIDWRRKFERKVVKHLLSKEAAVEMKLNWLLWAVKNKGLIFKALDTDRPEAYLVDKGKIVADHATYIMDQAVRRLSKLNGEELSRKIKESQATSKLLKDDISSEEKLTKRLVTQLKGLSL